MEFNRIRTNTPALEALANRARLGRELSASYRQLSSGLRINRAEDDSAGWSIAKKLNAKIHGLVQANENVLAARSVLDVAETSLVNISDRLSEIKKLATQAANGGIYGAVEMAFIRDAINSNASAIDNIVNQAQFNEINLLDGTYDANYLVGAEITDTLNFTIDENLYVEDTQVSQVSSEGSLSAAGPLTAATTLNALNQFSGLQAGDSFDIVVTAGDGTSTTVNIVLAGTKGSLATETVGDLLTAINGVANMNAFLDASGNIDVEEITPTDGNLLAVSIENYVEASSLDGATGTLSFSFQAASGGFITAFTSGGPFAGGTLLNDLDQFEDLEGNDTITVNLTARDGATATINYTLPGGTGNASTATISSLAAAITAGGGGKFQATVSSGQILIEEINLSQNSLNATSSFNEFSAGDAIVPSPPLTFAFSNEGMQVNLLDNLLNPATAGTLINNLNGFGNIHGGDSLSVTVTNRAGVSQAFSLVFNDVGDGILSNRTVGDLIAALDGQTVGATTLDVSLDGAGNLLILEDNPPQAGFSATGSYSETDLDITPKAFSNIDFAISDFLPITDSSGLVLSFGLESFNTSYAITSEIARYLIRNVDEAINRIADITNRLGVFQTALSTRETFLAQSIVSHSNAKSRVEDADMAKLQSNYLKQQILLQTQNSALAQANFAPQSLLRLLT